VLVAGVVVLTFGCRTTHQLGRASDPRTFAALEKVTTRAGVYAHVETLKGVAPRVPGDPVRGLTRDGFIVAPVLAPDTLVPFARVRSVSTYDRGRGARDGALALGLPALVIGGVIGALIVNAHATCSDGCPGPRGITPTVFGLAGLVGVGGAVLGAGFGALAGHEDRYVIAPE
jgi:hypothetical protein